MAKQYSADFFTSLLEAVQKLCREYLDFDQCVDVSGYLALEIDNYKKERFVISELLQSTGDFMSESYCTKAFKTSRRSAQRKDSILKEKNPVLERSRCLSISFSHQSVSSESSCSEDTCIASQTNLPSHQSMERDLSFNICQTPSATSTNSCASQTVPTVSSVCSSSQTHTDTSHLVPSPCVSTVSSASQTLDTGSSVSTISSASQTYSSVSTVSAASQTQTDRDTSLTPGPSVLTVSAASQTLLDRDTSLTPGSSVLTVSAASQTQTDRDTSLTPGPSVSTVSAASQTQFDRDTSLTPGSSVLTVSAASQTLLDRDTSLTPGSSVLTVSAASQTQTDRDTSLTPGPSVLTVSAASQTLLDRDTSLTPGSSVSTVSAASQTQFDRDTSLTPGSSVLTVSAASQTQTDRDTSLTPSPSVSTNSSGSQTQFYRDSSLTPGSKRIAANSGKCFTIGSTVTASACSSRTSRVIDCLSSPFGEQVKRHGTKRSVRTTVNIPDAIQHKIAKKTVVLGHEGDKFKDKHVVVEADKPATVKHVVVGTDKPATKHVVIETDKPTTKHVVVGTDKPATAKRVVGTDKPAIKHVVVGTDKPLIVKRVVGTDKPAIKHVIIGTDKPLIAKRIIVGTDKPATKHVVVGTDKLVMAKQVVDETDKAVKTVMAGGEKPVTSVVHDVVGDRQVKKKAAAAAAAVRMDYQEDNGVNQKSGFPVSTFSWETDASEFNFQSSERRSLEQKETDVFFTPGTEENTEFCKTSLCARHRYPFSGIKAHPNFQKAVTAVLQDIPTLCSRRDQVERLMLLADRDNRKRFQSRSSGSGVTRVRQSVGEVVASTSTVDIQSDSPKCPICYGTGFDRPVIVCSSCDGVYHEHCVVLPVIRKPDWVCSLCSDMGDDFIKTEPMDDLSQDGGTEQHSKRSVSTAEEQPIGTETQLEKLLKIFDCKTKAELVKLAQKGIPRHKLSDTQKSLLDSVFYTAFKSDYK